MRISQVERHSLLTSLDLNLSNRGPQGYTLLAPNRSRMLVKNITKGTANLSSRVSAECLAT